MELRQLRYFVSVVECGSMGRAALELGIVTSALSQQISKLESELATRLLQRTSTGTIPTDAGLAFWRQAQLALRHIDEAVEAAKLARLTGRVSVGLAPTTASVLGLPLIQAMRERYPDVRLHMVEGMSGHLASMLNARQLDLAILFQTANAQNWSVSPLLDERLFLIADKRLDGVPETSTMSLSQLGDMPLVLPTRPHGLRATLDSAFTHLQTPANIVTEIDSLYMLIDTVQLGHTATIQPGAALTLVRQADTRCIEITDPNVGRRNLLVSLSDNELSPVALATRVTIAHTVRQLVRNQSWLGATLLEP